MKQSLQATAYVINYTLTWQTSNKKPIQNENYKFQLLEALWQLKAYTVQSWKLHKGGVKAIPIIDTPPQHKILKQQGIKANKVGKLDLCSSASCIPISSESFRYRRIHETIKNLRV